MLTGTDQICPSSREVSGSRAKKLQSLISWIMIITLHWQILNGVTDSALSTLLKFICEILVVVGMPNNADIIRRVLPTSPHLLWNWLGMNRNDFQKLICCGHCYALYDSVERLQYRNSRGELRIRKCTSTSRDGKTICNNALLQEVKYADRVEYQPLFTYCYKPLSESLEALLMRPNFEDDCRKWKDRRIPSNFLADIYDGRIWREHTGPNKFLDDDNNLALNINVDFFTPYSRRSHISIGGVYLTVLNLPRNQRYLTTNVILLGIIPNLPKEPHTLNTFLKPLVEELKVFWNQGIVLKSHKFPGGKRVRVALLAVNSDVPAAKKICGFWSHSANIGCSRCLKQFGGGETRKVGGFERQLWEPRSHAQHMRVIDKINAESNVTKKVKIEKTNGLRYTILLELEYFKPVEYLALDAMHNLYMGIAKKTWKMYIAKATQKLSEKDIKKIDERLLEFRVGADEERAATYIGSNYGFWTAEQWLSFVTVSSAYCLQGLLPDEDLKIWEYFVVACRALTKPCLSLDDVDFADSKLLEFCVEAEKRYGDKFITPNFHYALHYRETLRDHGPVYASWCFAFERMNLRISDIPTNKRNVEQQYMRRFLLRKGIEDLKNRLPQEFATNFERLLPNSRKTLVLDPNVALVPELDMADCEERWKLTEGIELEGNGVVLAMEEYDRMLLLETYKKMYPSRAAQLTLENIPNVFKCHLVVHVGPMMYAGMRSKRKDRLSWVMAKWYESIDGSQELRPGQIQYFMKHNLKTPETGKMSEHVFALVKWHRAVTDPVNYISTITMWKSKLFEEASWATYLPVTRISGRFGGCKTPDGNNLVITSVPRPVYL